MVFYHAPRYQSASVGDRLVAVRCENCGCEYFYEMVRIGLGSASAPYGFGMAAARSAAAEQSHRELGERLACEAELVPCPNCHWIHDELVSGYRRSRYRGWAKFAGWAGFFGVVLSLFCAWFLAIGPAADRGALLPCLVFGPIISIAFALAVLLCQAYLRHRIQPNRDYPFFPRLPRGSPLARIINPASGQLEVVEPKSAMGPPSGGWLDFQIGRHQFPALCCECLLPATPESAYRRPVLPAVDLAVPLCSTCARRWTRRSWRVGLVSLGVMLGLAGGLLMAMRLGEVEFWIFFAGIGLPVAASLAACLAHHVTTPVHMRGGGGTRGIVQLRFRNPKFARHIVTKDGTPAQSATTADPFLE